MLESLKRAVVDFKQLGELGLGHAHEKTSATDAERTPTSAYTISANSRPSGSSKVWARWRLSLSSGCILADAGSLKLKMQAYSKSELEVYPVGSIRHEISSQLAH